MPKKEIDYATVSETLSRAGEVFEESMKGTLETPESLRTVDFRSVSSEDEPALQSKTANKQEEQDEEKKRVKVQQRIDVYGVPEEDSARNFLSQ